MPLAAPVTTATLSLNRPISGLLEDVDGAGGAHARPAADHVRKAELRVPDLPLSGIAAQVSGDLVDVGDAGSAQGMAFGQQPAGDIHRDAAAQLGVAVVDQPSRLAVGAEAEVLVVNDLGRGEAVVQLDEAEVLRPDAGCLIGGP